MFKPGHVWSDHRGVPINAHGGGVLYHDEVYYWFGEHKVEGDLGNSAQVGVHVYASRNLYEWIDSGIAFSVSDDSSSEIAQGCILERPKVLYNQETKKFVLWFHLELKETVYRSARTGVAVSDQPTGPYLYMGSMRPNAGVWAKNVPPAIRKELSEEEGAYIASIEHPGNPETGCPPDLIYRRDFVGGQMARDMTLFLDDDGKAYHIYSSEENATLHVSQLSDDYLRHSGNYARILIGGFNEAPTIMKRDGRYFLITSGCTGWDPNAGRLFASKSIWGPWDYLGNPCHGTVSEINTTFESQGTFILKVEDRRDCYIFMADRWRPKNPIDGRYIWLPVVFKNNVPSLLWRDGWTFQDDYK